MLIQTIIVLKSQFCNIFEGARPSSLTYSASYSGDDTQYVASFEDGLIDEVCTQTDFWDCVENYKESYSVHIKVLDENYKEKYEAHLTTLITNELVKRLGRPPESSFLDDMTEEEKTKAKQAGLRARFFLS